MADYLDNRAGDVMKFLALVPPAAPSRVMDAGNITQGISGLPIAVGVGAGSIIYDLFRWHLVYKSHTLRIRGTLHSSGGGGTATDEFKQYEFIQNLQVSVNGSDIFQTWGGSDLHLYNLWQGMYRNTEATGNDVLATAPGASASTNFDLSWIIPYHEQSLLYPRLFGLANFYEQHGVVSAQLRIDLGQITQFVTGDAGLTMTALTIELSHNVLDYGDLVGYGVAYVQETAFPRLETRLLRSLPIINATQQRTKLDRGLYYRFLLVQDLTAAGTDTQANNVYQSIVQRDAYDPFFNQVRIPHLQRVLADNCSNVFTSAGRPWAYVFDFAPQREVTQLINTQLMTDWDLLVSAAAAGQIRILEGLYNIPVARIKKKDPRSTMRAKSY